MAVSPFVYDLLSDLRSNHGRKEAVDAALKHMDRVVQDMADGKASRYDLASAQADIIPKSGFNFGLLIPAYFTKYPLNKPLSFIDRPFMFSMTCLAPNSVVTLKAGRQVGKCADGDTVVATNNGPRTLRSIFDSGAKV